MGYFRKNHEGYRDISALGANGGAIDKLTFRGEIRRTPVVRQIQKGWRCGFVGHRCSSLSRT